MTPDRKELSQQEQENLRSTASWLNAELEGGACFWREDITSAIRQFPSPILIDLDDTLVEAGNRKKVNPQAQEALQRAEQVGSVFIVTSGLATIDYLKELGLAGDRTVLITKNNYPQDTPAFAASEVQKYIATQQPLRRGYNPDDFELENRQVKHFAPLFMKKRPVPLIDDSIWATVNNPGILGLTLHNPKSAVYQQSATKEYNLEIIPDLLEAVRRAEIHYGPPFEQLQAVFAKLFPTTNPNIHTKYLKDEFGGQYRLLLQYIPPDPSLDKIIGPLESYRMLIDLQSINWLNAQVHKIRTTNDCFTMLTYTWNGRGYIPFKSYRLDGSMRNVNFQENLESVVDWFISLTRPDATFTVHPYFFPRHQFQE